MVLLDCPLSRGLSSFRLEVPLGAPYQRRACLKVFLLFLLCSVQVIAVENRDREEGWSAGPSMAVAFWCISQTRHALPPNPTPVEHVGEQTVPVGAHQNGGHARVSVNSPGRFSVLTTGL